MTKGFFVWVICCALMTVAFAQAPQSQQPPSVGEQVLSQRLMEEINQNLNLRAQIMKLQEELKAKAEPKAADKPQSEHK